MSGSIGARRAACLTGAALGLYVAFVAIRPGIVFASTAASSTISGAQQLAFRDSERGGGQVLPPTPQGGGLNAVQCWAAGHCLAVGGSARGVLVDRLSGTRWSIVAAPNPGAGSGTPSLTGLSCIGSRWCLAVGFNRCGGPLAERWNGKSWSLVNVDLRACKSGLADVSCASRSFCMALDDGEVVTWGGAAWRLAEEPSPGSYNEFGFQALSCAARDACAEVGGDGVGDNLVGWWNGHDWAVDEGGVAGYYRFGPDLDSVSCASVRFCMAVGSGANDGEGDAGEAIEWNGSSWGKEGSPSPLTNAVVVSCVSRADCVAINATPSVTTLNGTNKTSAAIFNGRGWTTTASAFDAYPTAISCPVAGWCMVVGYLLNPKTGNPVTPAAASVQ
jgi:hypothetical protein